MNSKAITSTSFIQNLIDKYIYHVVINNGHKKHVMENLNNGNIYSSHLRAA